jgi:hypothetical protein
MAKPSFDVWANQHRAVVDRLLAQPHPNKFLSDMAYKLRNREVLTDRMLIVVDRIFNEQIAPPQSKTITQNTRRPYPADLGLYRHDGRLYVVREFTPQGETRKVRFARELVANTGSQADRAGMDGSARKLHSIRAPGMQWQLEAHEAVSLDEVKQLGIQFGECVICGKPIETKASVEDRAGVGPVCSERQSRLLASRTAP